VTVCIAGLFKWNYGTLQNPELGFGAITVSDRKITLGDIEGEPNQAKIATFGTCLVLVAGDLTVHSQAIRDTSKQLNGRRAPPEDIARIYGRAIQSINARHAESEILAPFSLNTDTFFAQQKEFSHGFVDAITAQMQNRQPADVEALVVGSNGEHAQIYLVDSRGKDYCMDDASFAAIGIGAWHAKSRLMSLGYVNSRSLAPALTALYAAKKGAELAPGVGTTTDIRVVLKDAHFDLWENVDDQLTTLFKKYNTQANALGDQMIAELAAYLDRPQQASQSADDKGQGPFSPNAQADGDASEDAPEVPRRDEIEADVKAKLN
jgi:hypothetical protein